MRLLKLYANMPTFRTVTFRPSGLSLIVAKKDDSSAQTTTYNGVGKSLMLELLHYCLGSSKRSAFAEHLKDWIFSLDVEVAGVTHTISRSAAKAGDIHLDGDKVTLPKLKEFLEDACLEFRSNIPQLTIRSIIPRFIRSGEGAYLDFSHANLGEVKNPHAAMLRTAFLLGLDLHLIKDKYELRSRRRKLTDTMTQLEKEPTFAKLLTQDTVDIELIALKETAERLGDDLSSFRIAEDYHEIEQEANQIKRDLDGHRREEVKLDDAIAQIERSLKPRSDLPAERVFRLYEEARTALPESVQKRVEDVVNFQQELQRKRQLRLSRERQWLDRELKKERESIKSLSVQLDEKLQYLSEHRALDEYVAVNNKLSEVQQQIGKLEESKALRSAVDHELKEIDLSLATENLRADEYLESAHALIHEAMTTFRSFARELYGSRPSGLSISNDSSDNPQRYRIDAHIKADKAGGINEAKIFCFDMTVLSLRRNHRFQFLVHDSTLFDPIDPTQLLTMFRIADRVCRELGVQYIAALNRHNVTAVREQTQAEEAELDALFGEEQTVVLALTPANKLLGIDVDMDYTK